MENKVSLYNSNDIKIGETFPRRARQLVKQQRAKWIDGSQSSIRFAPGMENMDTAANISTEITTEDSLAPNQLCFAHWNDGYYYPAVISDVLPTLVKVAFLDGDSGQVALEHIARLHEAFDILDFECAYGLLGSYYRGVVISQQPIVFQYDDGVVEQTELRNLRGRL